MIVGAADVGVIRRIRRAIEADRGGSRPDVARELSIAITSLEDAEMRLTRALIRASRHAGDGDQAVDNVGDQLLDEADTEPDQQEVNK